MACNSGKIIKIDVTPNFELLSVFMAGLSILQPLQVTLVGSGNAMRRFGYGPEAIGPFLGMTYCFQELFCLMGVICTNLVNFFFGANRYAVYIKGTYSMILSSFIALVNVRLLLVFGTSIGDSNLTMYYWTLSISGFCFGAFDGTVRSFSPMNNDIFSLGMSLGGALLTIYLTVMSKILTYMKVEMGYWMLYYQINFCIVLSFVSGIMWNIVVIFGKFGPEPIQRGAPSNPQMTDVLKEAWPFMAMFSTSLGFSFTVYPSVAPFMLVPFDKSQIILRVCLCLDSCSAILSLCLARFCGMNQKWEGPRKWYFLTAALFIPYFMVYFSFIRVIHYPDGTLGKMIYQKPKVVFLLCVVYYFCARFTCHASIGNMFGNIVGTTSTKPADTNHVGTVMIMTGCLGIFSLVFFKFIFEGYLKAFRGAKAAVDSGLPWPTEGYGECRALLYWIGASLKGGLQMLFNVWTFDVRSKILG